MTNSCRTGSSKLKVVLITLTLFVSVSVFYQSKFQVYSVLHNYCNGKHREATAVVRENPHCSEEYRASHWITTVGMGRTGNLMFQLATLLATARITCRTPAISPIMDRHLSGIFNLTSFPKIKDINVTKNWHRFGESCRHSWQLFNLDSAYNWTISGYLNSWKNFAFYSDYIKKVFTFNKTIVTSARVFLSSDDLVKACPKNKGLTIGIHVRRGDFLNLYKAGFRVADVNYTTMARDYYRKLFPGKQLCFIVVSNDMKWCKENILGDNVFYSNLTTPAEDMALLSMCDHSIISTGTFGWFGAWLAGGRVTYYSDFPRRNSTRCPSNGDDFLIPSWVGLP